MKINFWQQTREGDETHGLWEKSTWGWPMHGWGLWVGKHAHFRLESLCCYSFSNFMWSPLCWNSTLMLILRTSRFISVGSIAYFPISKFFQRFAFRILSWVLEWLCDNINIKSYHSKDQGPHTLDDDIAN